MKVINFIVNLFLEILIAVILAAIAALGAVIFARIFNEELRFVPSFCLISSAFIVANTAMNCAWKIVNRETKLLRKENKA